MTDPIADMLTRIRNANKANHTEVEIPSSRMKASIAKLLLEQGYITGFESPPASTASCSSSASSMARTASA